jgi:hypothetical protein
MIVVTVVTYTFGMGAAVMMGSAFAVGVCSVISIATKEQPCFTNLLQCYTLVLRRLNSM